MSARLILASAACVVFASFAAKAGEAFPLVAVPAMQLDALSVPNEGLPFFSQDDALSLPEGGEDASKSSALAVEGNERIEAETVLSYMTKEKEGEPYSDADLDASVKALYATGLFADVVILRKGSGIVVRVVENPIVNRIAFEGNKRIEDATLEPELQLRPRQVFTQTKVQEDVKRILDLYRRNGRYAVQVEPKIIRLEQNRVDLVFEIVEGPTTYIRRINFVGNKRYKDQVLRDAIVSREEVWYRLFSAVDTYDPDRTAYDRELVRRFYLRNGYADFRVVSVVAELIPDRTGFFITFALDEGERYRFGTIDLDVRLPRVDPEVLRSQIESKSGEWYNADEIENATQALTEKLGELGYAFVEVRPRVQRNEATKTVDVVYEVQEGARVFIDRIDIVGNTSTLDKVIRREIILAEGDAFNIAKLRRSRDNIRNLGFFDRVDVTTVPSDDEPDRSRIQVAVGERSTGEAGFSLGWSSASGALLDLQIRQRNLLGRGQDLKLNGRIGEKEQTVDFGFTEPYFLGRRLLAGVDLFNRLTDYQKEASYNLGEIGGAVRFGFNYTDYWRQSLRYTLSETDIRGIQSSASPYIKRRGGSSLFSGIGQSLTYDRRDSAIDPSEGYILRLSNELAGLGGDEEYLNTTVDVRTYTPIFDDTVFVAGGNAGYILSWGKGVPYYRNYMLGGSNLRGFRFSGASPHDKTTGDYLGGKWMATATAELQFPLGLPEELGLKGKIFSDVGVIGKPDGIPIAALNYSLNPRASVGVGLLWKSPLGLINIDFGMPVLKEDFDRRETFMFSFGSRF